MQFLILKKYDFQYYFSKYEKAPLGFKLICNSLGQTLTTWLHSNLIKLKEINQCKHYTEIKH